MRAVVVCFAALLPLAAAGSGADPAAVERFARDAAGRYGLDAAEIGATLAQAQWKPVILEAISRPAETKPWHEYRKIFLTEARIAGGVAFWNRNAELLDRVEAAYGVPPQIVTAIIGVETRYGANTGSFRVLDSLYTLGFGYPKRSEFFLGELAQFLALAREERVDPLAATGSYAGAMGMPQFISSSYRRYAVDFDGDDRRDLWNSTADIIGSVGNYFALHGWRAAAPVAYRATVAGEPGDDHGTRGLKPWTTLAELAAAGVEINPNLPGTTPAALIRLDQTEGPEYWAGLDNFYTITRYNHSALYAMAVFQLSEEIRERHEQAHSLFP
ncbi:MAG: lytic murein transglycosylase B [Chromatiales bacterium]|nr:lytic murein transglycosylase B [Chromatiales bacterium]